MTTNNPIHSIDSNLQLHHPQGQRVDEPCIEKTPGQAEILYPLTRKAGYSVMEGCLEKKALLRLTGNHSGEKLSVVSGLVWVTQSGDPEDVFLRAGESFDIIHKGAVLIEGVVETRLEITTPASGRSLGGAVHHFVSGL